jgi:pentatricopeptide repeat protein
VGLFKACGEIPDLEQGKRFHGVADRQGFVRGNVFLGTALLSMYERCGAPQEAEQLFASLDDRNVVTWNAMLSMYVQRGDGEKAVKLFRQMEGEGNVCADRETLLFAIQACGILAAQKKASSCARSTSVDAPCLEIGCALHRIVRRKRLESDSFIGAALLKMYGRCSAVSEAENVFASLTHRDIVVWTTMLAIYIEHGRGESALELYTGMQAEDLSLDDASIVCILQGCCDRGSLGICESVHFAVVAAGCDENCAISATLIHAYGNCMSASDARAIFEKQSDPDVVSWNACISGYVGEGNTGEAICLFERLKGKIRPDDVTFMLLLSACSHSGLVAEGLEYLESMTQTYGLDPNPKHYGILIDLLGRRGEFMRISSMLKTMPVQADQTMWLSLLNSCESYGNVNLGEEVFHHAVCLDPYHATPYALMSKIYADAGWAECAAKIEHLRQHTVAYGI